MTINALSRSLISAIMALVVSGPEYFRTVIRRDVAQIQCNATVFVGGSRLKCAIDIATWKKQMNSEAVELVIMNTSPRRFVVQLADDEIFNGRIIIEVSEHVFYAVDTELCEEGVMTSRHITEGEKNLLFAELKTAVNKIESRGGNVIFVRLPSSGTLLTREVSDYPRADYWNKLLESGDTPGFHFMDYEETASLTCADGAHLSPADAVIYTRHLSAMVRNERGYEEY